MALSGLEDRRTEVACLPGPGLTGAGEMERFQPRRTWPTTMPVRMTHPRSGRSRPRRAGGPAPRQAQTVHPTVCVRASAYRIAFGPRAGQKALTALTAQNAMPWEVGFEQDLYADIKGFSLPQMCAAGPMSARRRSSCAAKSPARLRPMRWCRARACT